jgi:puromycin-sensitive aminopeptidase
MSTYLLCWCIGEFDSIAAMTKHGVLCKVYTPPGRGESGRFALDVAVRTLDLYDDFFMVPYPLPKLDMIAIMDFAAGAMENWGLVTYREVDLLIDEAKASSQQRQRVASVVAHELAHQWFGNLVTMAWWDDLWLNEGFASWTQSFALDNLFPEWGMWTQFIAVDQATAMRLDAMRTSHPIQVPIGRAEEVEEVFDAISYCKGASVVRMLYAVLGPADFQKGLQIYMERHQYGNTETFHLWRAWEEASGKPISDIMSSWTSQMGFPLLEVLSQKDDLYGVTTLDMRQVWFLADGSEPDKRKWTVPVTVTTGEAKMGEYTAMTFEKETLFRVTIPPLADSEKHQAWFKLNAGQHAPLRVVYKDYEPLIAAVKAGQVGPEDRAGLLLDAYALAKAGHPSMSPLNLVNLVQAYENEDHATVWEALEIILCGLDKLLAGAGTEHAELRNKFVAFAARIVAPAAAAVGWVPRDDDGHLGKLKRATLVRLQAHFCLNDEAVVAQARALWAKELDPENKEEAVPADFKPSVFKIVLANATSSAEFDALMSHLSTLTVIAERKQIYNSIGSAHSVALKRKVLEWAVSGQVKLQDFFYPIGSVSGSGPEGLELAWTFFQENYERIRGMIAKASPSLMDAAIVYSVAGFATDAKADEISAYFTDADGKPKLPQNNRKIQQTVEGIRTNAAFSKRILECGLDSVLNDGSEVVEEAS